MFSIGARAKAWIAAFVGANQGPGPQRAPGYNFYPVRPVRSPGAAGMGFQVLTELPYTDFSGPTVPNGRNIMFIEGATYPAVKPTYVLAGSIQGVPNLDAIGVDGLFDTYEFGSRQASG